MEIDALIRQRWTLVTAYEALRRGPFAEGTAQQRTRLLEQLAHARRSRPMYDTERGVNGGLFDKGGVEVWNPEEYSPWIITEPLTLVAGDLVYVDSEFAEGGRRDDRTRLEIDRDARVFVLGDLRVGRLAVRAGELHCLGEIAVRHRLELGESVYVSPASGA